VVAIEMAADETRNPAGGGAPVAYGIDASSEGDDGEMHSTSRADTMR
jgi:hypothetical protein